MVTTTDAAAAAAPASRRRTFADRSEHRDWNFLVGAGPSSSAMYHAEEKSAWKPGWKSRRNVEAITPGKDREQRDVAKVERSTAIQVMRADRLNERASNFNPVSGQPAGDAWAHQKPGTRSLETIKASGAFSTSNPVVKAAAQQSVYEMRKERIGNSGMSTAALQKGGTAADCLRWG